MRIGEKVVVDLFALAKPMEGRIATVKFENEKPVTVRVEEVRPTGATVKVIPEGTRD